MNKITQKFTFPETQGVAALFAGSTLNGLPMKSVNRKGTKVIVTYEKEEVVLPQPELSEFPD